MQVHQHKIKRSLVPLKMSNNKRTKQELEAIKVQSHLLVEKTAFYNHLQTLHLKLQTDYKILSSHLRTIRRRTLRKVLLHLS